MVKKIHYIWLGGQPKSALIQKCIKSWKKYLPGWEIIEWNESNVNLNACAYGREAYDQKMYAFTSDVLRFQILRQHGGLYMDVDVEIIRPLEALLAGTRCAVGFEFNGITVAPGLLLYAAQSNNTFISAMDDMYHQLHFEYAPGELPTTICQYATEYLQRKGLKTNDTLQELGDVTVFPATYFSPVNREWSVQKFSKETRCIHHYNASWLGGAQQKRLAAKRTLFKMIGPGGICFLKGCRSCVRNLRKQR